MDWEQVKKQWPRKDKEFTKILSIDGGGIRGVFPARYLANIEGATGKPIHEYFDLIVGTSTGGIIALALASGISAEEITELYVKKGSELFQRRFWPLPKILTPILGARYSNKQLKSKLREIFGDRQMKDAKSMLCIPALEHHKASPKVYKTPHNDQLHADKELYMWQVAMATSAAPFFFQPVCVTGNDCKLDGGLWANNPVMIGIAEAVQNEQSLDKIKVLSIGTGLNVYNAGPLTPRLNSIFSWRTNIVDLAMNAQSEGYVNTANYLLKDKHVRINFKAKSKLGLDSVSKSSVKELLYEADSIFEKTYKNNVKVYNQFFGN